MAAPRKSRKTSAVQSTAESSSVSVPSMGRRRIIVTGLLVLVVGTVWAFLQPARPNPLATPSFWSIDNWKYPRERNAFLRVHQVHGELLNVFALPQTTHVWVVGQGGLVAHSADAGETWTAQNLKAPLATSRAVQTSRAPSASGTSQVITAAAQVAEEMPNGDGPPSPLLATQQLNQGQARQSTVPDVSGRSLQEAIKLLQSAGLRVSDADEKLAMSGDYVVTSQAPAYGTRAARGTVVRLQVRATPQPNAPPQTDPRQQLVDTAALRDSAALAPSLGTGREEGEFYPALNAVCFADAARGWVVGERGVALFTADSGRSWRQVSVPVAGELLMAECAGDGRMAAATLTEFVLVSANGDSVVRSRTPGGAFHSLGWTATRELRALTYGVGVQSGPVTGLWRGIDEGQSWARAEAGFLGGLSAIAIGRAGDVFAAARDSGLRRLPNPGATWATVACLFATDSSSRPSVTRIAFLDARTGIALDESGYTWTSDDDWQSCVKSSRQAVAADSVSRARLAMGTPNAMYAVDGGLRVSRDQGRTWQLRVSSQRMRAITFLDSTRGWAGTVDGHVLRTTDGGRTWEGGATDSLLREPVTFIAARTPHDVFAADANDMESTVYWSADGGNSWVRSAYTADTVVPVFFTSAQRGYGIAGDSAFVTQDGGRTWSRSPPFIEVDSWEEVIGDPIHIAFGGGATIDSLVTWLVDSDGQLFRRRGVRGAIDTSAAGRLVAAVPVTATLGYGLDSLGDFAVSRDGGATWSAGDVLPYRKRPAPWWFFPFLPLCIGATALAVRRSEVPDDPELSVADLLVSDRPLRKGDKDVLDFATIAGGLSRFLRNPQTQPPLTIAVSGPWGSGKSSLMLMLKQDLEERAFRTVWFNAWHHQREEALLASLLESIKARVTPKAWTWMGIRFRARLLGRRFSRYAVPVMLLAPFLAFAVAWLASDWDNRVDDVRALFGSVGNLIGEVLGRPTDSTRAVADSTRRATTDAAGSLGANPTKTFIALLISIVGSALTYLKGLKTFGVNPSVLAKSVAGATKVRTLEAQATFRYRFAQDFREVTEALHPERLVIFIDDLDRCKPEQVLEILEAVNFLVDSGDCVVVLGMDRDRVIGCVAIGFKEVATILAAMKPEDSSTQGAGAGSTPPRLVKDEDRGAPPARDEKAALMRQQLDYARHYLEKLVNMELPIPTTTAIGIANVMTNAKESEKPEQPGRRSDASNESPATDDGARDPNAPNAEKRKPPRVHRSWREYALPAQVTFAVAASIVAVVVGIRMGRPSLGTELGAPVTVVERVPADATDTTRTAARPDTTQAARELALAGLQLVPAAEGERPWVREVFFAVVAIGLLLWLVTPREERRVHDSPGFVQALRAWAPVLHGEFRTPRAAKRFVNHVRFLAMAQRKPGPPRTPIQDFFAALRDVPWMRWVAPLLPQRRAREDELPATALKDVALVTLAVVSERYPDWLNDKDFWDSDIETYATARFAQRANQTRELPEDLSTALEQLRAELARQGVSTSESTMKAHIGRREDWERLREWTRLQ